MSITVQLANSRKNLTLPKWKFFPFLAQHHYFGLYAEQQLISLALPKKIVKTSIFALPVAALGVDSMLKINQNQPAPWSCKHSSDFSYGQSANIRKDYGIRSHPAFRSNIKHKQHSTPYCCHARSSIFNFSGFDFSQIFLNLSSVHLT